MTEVVDARGISAPQLDLSVVWNLYFEGQPQGTDDPRGPLITSLASFLASSRGKEFLDGVTSYQGGYIAAVDYEAFQEACGSVDFTDAITHQPCEGLACLGAAMYLALFQRTPQEVGSAVGNLGSPGKITARIVNFRGSEVYIRQLKSNLIGKLATVRGTVVRMSPIRPLITSIEFTCKKCGRMIVCNFEDGRYTPPQKCTMIGCRNRSFTPQLGDAQSIDYQKIRIQEILGADKEDEGRIPRTVEIEMKSDLVNCCTAGDVVTVIGLVNVIDAEAGGSGKSYKSGKQGSCLFLLYLDAVSIVNHNVGAKKEENKEKPEKRKSLMDGAAAPNMVDFTMKDLEFVLHFTSRFQGDQFRQLLHALCPSIYGHELVKAGLLLSLLGGVRKNTGANGKIPVRGDIHILVVGDPGLGKSQLLQASCSASPRGLYVCGNTSTSTGLTVSVVKDSMTGDFTFEAGALVLADGGVCCIDEFDKMTAEHQILLEAMEQQEVSVAKAGLVANLPARSAVIAAANPIWGHYNRARTVVENLKISSAMLSRFDLVFILMDRPDMEMDHKLSEHVMALHSGASDRSETVRFPAMQLKTNAAGPLIDNDPNSLANRLKLDPSEEDSLLPTQLLRKYIAYARQYATPKLSEEAKEVMRAFYLHLRQTTSPLDGTPVTARQLESMVRLGEARAKADLREVVTKQDAEDVVQLMKEVLYDKFLEGTGMIDFRKGGRRSKRNEAQRFLRAVAAFGNSHQKNELSMTEIYGIADNIELQIEDIQDFVEQLNEAGELLKAGPQLYKLPHSHGSTTTSGISQTSSMGSQMSKRRRHDR